MARFGSTLALLVLASDVGCGKSSVDLTSAEAAAAGARSSPPPLIEGRGITASHIWTWSPKNARVAGGIAIETFVTLTAAAGYLRAPSTSVRLVTVTGALIPVVDAAQSTCTDLLALGETRRCTFRFEIPVSEKPERLEIHVAPEPAIVIAIANPPPTSGPCVADVPCTPCSLHASGMECQNAARARGLEPTCSVYEDAGLGRKITLYCPPGYRRRDPAPPLGQ